MPQNFIKNFKNLATKSINELYFIWDFQIHYWIRLFSNLSLTEPFWNGEIFFWKTNSEFSWGRIFSRVRPAYERAVSDLDRSMHISLWVWVAHSLFIEGSHMTKNTASGIKNGSRDTQHNDTQHNGNQHDKISTYWHSEDHYSA